MALFKISKGLAANLMIKVPYAKEGFAYFTTDDGKLYIDITGNGTNTKAQKGINRICLNADYADRLKIQQGSVKAQDNQVVRFDGINGNVQGSEVTIDDEGALVATKVYVTDSRVNQTTNQTEIADIDTEKYDFGVVGASYFQGNIDIKGNITLKDESTIGGTKMYQGSSADVLGTAKKNTVISNQLTLQKGAVFGGSAQEAGLVTRGICGISTPTGDGTCSKNNLYINFDGDTTYRAARQVVLQAGSVGAHYGQNLYQFAAARGDAVHDWALDNFYLKSEVDEKDQHLLELGDALIYQGTIAGGSSSPGTFTFAANRGDVYKVSAAGYINGQPVEVGDLFICNTDKTNAASSSTYTTIQANWDVINTNVDGAAFIGTGKSLTDKSLVVANGTKGQLKSSGAIGSTTQPFYINSSGIPTAITYTANRLYYPSATNAFTAGNHYISNDKIQINGISAPGYNLQVAGTTNLAGETTSRKIVPANDNSYELGSSDKRWLNIYGKLIGQSYEAYQLWGGRNLKGEFSPIDAALNPVLGANRLAGIKPAGVTVECSSDGGATWTTYNNLSDLNKTALFTTSSSINIRGNETTASANSKVRITIDGVAGGVYTRLNKLQIYITTNYSNNCTVTMESYDYNSSTTWHPIITDQEITGWSGWNVLNFNLTGTGAFGGTNNIKHQRKIRLTFSNESVSSGHESQGLRILKIYGYGGVGWNTPSVLASNGVPYSYDSNLNVKFPALLYSQNDQKVLDYSDLLTTNKSKKSVAEVWIGDGLYAVQLDSDSKLSVNIPFAGTNFNSGNQNYRGHDCNTNTDNGHYYYTANGPTTTLGASTNDGALYVQSHSDKWVGQIAQDYRNGRLFVRGKNDGTWTNWLKILTKDETDSTYKKIQTAVAKVGNSDGITFIDTIAQDTQGKITTSLKVVRDASKTQSGVISTGTQVFAGAKTFANTVTIGENGCTLQYNSTNQCLDFVFA